MKRKSSLCYVKAGSVCFAALLLACGSAQAEVKVHGATSVTFGLMKPYKAEIEKLAGVELSILPSSTSRGLSDLAQGKADVAMLAESLETAAASMIKKEPGSINPADFADAHVGDAYVQFIVHPSNSVQGLTKAQLADLFSGKAKNWSEAGGPNLPVLLVGEPTSSPHQMIQENLAVTFSSDMRAVQNTNQTALIVAQAPGALSYISTAHDVADRGKLKVVDSDVKLPLKLFLAYKKTADQQVMKVVDAAKAVGSR